MTLAIAPGERVRAAAINSRPTCAMNLTAGSAAAARGGAAVRPARANVARMHPERAAAARRGRQCDPIDRRVPVTLDMSARSPPLPPLAQGRAPAAALSTRATLTTNGVEGQRYWLFEVTQPDRPCHDRPQGRASG